MEIIVTVTRGTVRFALRSVPFVHMTVHDPCADLPLSVHCVMPPLAGHRVHGAVRWMGEATSLYTGRRGQGQQKHGRARRRLICPRLPSTLPLLSTTSGNNLFKPHHSCLIMDYIRYTTSDKPAKPHSRTRTPSVMKQSITELLKEQCFSSLVPLISKIF